MKILNLYAGLGGNRKYWGDEHEITAVEFKPEIAKIYQDHFPADRVIVADAHKYLLEHYKEYDFIWSSPPCPTHSRGRFAIAKGTDFMKYPNLQRPIYPSMILYEEIIFFQFYFKGKWCVENVLSFYEPLIPPNEIAGHYFWTNFIITDYNTGQSRGHDIGIRGLEERKGFDLKKYTGIDKRLALRNCVEPELGKHILDLAINPIELNQKLI